MIHPDIVGCDVSKHYLDLYDAGACERLDNTAAICAALAERFASRFVVFEATGSYDRHLREALAAKGAAFARVNPGRARDFARAAGFLAKTDKVDAKMLAAFGQALAPGADAKPDPARESHSVSCGLHTWIVYAVTTLRLPKALAGPTYLLWL